MINKSLAAAKREIEGDGLEIGTELLQSDLRFKKEVIIKSAAGHTYKFGKPRASFVMGETAREDDSDGRPVFEGKEAPEEHVLGRGGRGNDAL